MSESQSSYQQVVKTMSLFGGVQVFNIAITLLRSKMMAVLLGLAGMGIAGLFNSTLGLIAALTNFGLMTSSVKSISAAALDQDEIAHTIAVLKKLIWFTGILGMCCTIFFSPWISRLAFGNPDYSWPLIWISITILLTQLTNGHLAVLQGLRKLNHLAKANLAGSFFGLLVTIPLYYLYGTAAIVPAIVLAAGCALFFSWFYSRKIQVKRVKVTHSEAITSGKSMLRLGFSLSFIGLLTTLSAYLVQIFISHSGGLQQVGLYNAGSAIINTYVGLVFTAMSMDYFPRLAAVSENNAKMREIVRQQVLIAVLIIMPIIIVFLAFAPLIVRILYSADFMPIVSFISLGMLGMLFKAASWSMGYILIAKGDSKLFIKTSIFFNLVFLINNVVTYHFFGFEGMGFSFLGNFIIHFICVLWLCRKKYEFRFSVEFYRIFGYCVLFCLSGFLSSKFTDGFLKYSLLTVILLLSVAFSLYELNKKTDFKQAIIGKLKKNDR